MVTLSGDKKSQPLRPDLDPAADKSRHVFLQAEISNTVNLQGGLVVLENPGRSRYQPRGAQRSCN
jgi:hypothetical protein